ncbi:hypothetical protein BBP40_003634 [Aspergillus hancockii]|nr:hypothetical protein BBP40_003634 [Aspergillus hancockii]
MPPRILLLQVPIRPPETEHLSLRQNFSEKDTRKYLPPGNLRHLFGLKADSESEKYLELMISADEAQFYLDHCKIEELRAFVRRAFIPDSELTPVHFDQMYLRAGPPTSLTAYRAEDRGVCKNAGNLSDEARVSAFNQNMDDGGCLSRDTVGYGRSVDRKWLIGEYEVGDVIFHNPWMVHASCKNKDPKKRIRLATDLRLLILRSRMIG